MLKKSIPFFQHINEETVRRWKTINKLPGKGTHALFFPRVYDPFLFFPFFPILWAVKPQQPLVAVDHPAARATSPVKDAVRRRSLPWQAGRARASDHVV